MCFISSKAIKGQVMADCLAEYPILKSFKLYVDILDEITEANMTFEELFWQLFFNGATKRTVTRVGVIIIFPYKYVVSH